MVLGLGRTHNQLVSCLTINCLQPTLFQLANACAVLAIKEIFERPVICRVTQPSVGSRLFSPAWKYSMTHPHFPVSLM